MKENINLNILSNNLVRIKIGLFIFSFFISFIIIYFYHKGLKPIDILTIPVFTLIIYFITQYIADISGTNSVNKYIIDNFLTHNSIESSEDLYESLKNKNEISELESKIFENKKLGEDLNKFKEDNLNKYKLFDDEKEKIGNTLNKLRNNNFISNEKKKIGNEINKYKSKFNKFNLFNYEKNETQEEMPQNNNLIPEEMPQNNNLIPEEMPQNNNLIPEEMPQNNNLIPEEMPQNNNLIPEEMPQNNNLIPEEMPQNNNLIPEEMPQNNNIVIEEDNNLVEEERLFVDKKQRQIVKMNKSNTPNINKHLLNNDLPDNKNNLINRSSESVTPININISYNNNTPNNHNLEKFIFDSGLQNKKHNNKKMKISKEESCYNCPNKINGTNDNLENESLKNINNFSSSKFDNIKKKFPVKNYNQKKDLYSKNPWSVINPKHWKSHNPLMNQY